MSKEAIEILKCDSGLGNAYPFLEGISAGFPSPAEEYLENVLDLTEAVVRNPNSTFFGRVRGNSMIEAKISDGDILVIDKSIRPRNGNFVVCSVDGEFLLKTLKVESGVGWLVPANSAFKPIRVTKENDFQIWGTVTWILHRAENVRAG
ncbi:LexA family protein [Leptospira stimsonii]|uniref:LexA family protein n=1 Tax=Leptospira stimsonii TaxID=2202203 RepID=UPI001FEE7536|nr:translesion error-prone DNA polymerase V autoproteolytic subunit [Leptospira stimsonii]